jgi:hypothetical protein
VRDRHEKILLARERFFEKEFFASALRRSRRATLSRNSANGQGAQNRAPRFTLPFGKCHARGFLLLGNLMDCERLT